MLAGSGSADVFTVSATRRGSFCVTETTCRPSRSVKRTAAAPGAPASRPAVMSANGTRRLMAPESRALRLSLVRCELLGAVLPVAGDLELDRLARLGELRAVQGGVHTGPGEAHVLGVLLGQP